MPGYAVVDLETTGLRPSWHDRIVEIGIVLLDPDGEQEATWQTLVNPQRDLGPQEVHGIAAADVLAAPTFADVAGTVADLLRGRTLVAHNAPFDTSFLRASYEALGLRVPIRSATSLCTMRWAGRLMPRAPRTLAGCCTHAGIHLHQHHAALADATATAALLRHLMDITGRPHPQHRSASATHRTWSPPWPGMVFNLTVRLSFARDAVTAVIEGRRQRTHRLRPAPPSRSPSPTAPCTPRSATTAASARWSPNPDGAPTGTLIRPAPER